MLKTVGPLELAIILAIVLLVFGAGKLPEVGAAIGNGIKEFRGAMRELDEIDEEEKEKEA